ncbi:DUF4126 domain-containing protein [Brevundimonas sp.]|uniref:DUF4126 domain-containing protein n=1 Tax=Brevundimonas sp. TaxID=1871086 RepID=UPI0025B9BB80|nr:DUF4126 domain-containing protein [Brevundimonas sp.]
MIEQAIDALGGMTTAVQGWGEPFAIWIVPALLGLGLAASTGLRTFLPLLMLALAARFGWFGIQLNEQMQWLHSDAAVAVLGVAAAVEFTADKIPVVDNALSGLGLVVRPLAAALAAGSLFVGVDPLLAAVAGIIVGAPTALAFNAAQGGLRLASTAATGGLGNPVLSLFEDVLAFFTALLALLAPVLVPVFLVVLALIVGRTARRLRRRPGRQSV